MRSRFLVDLMDPLTHDPRIKQNIKDSLYHHLYDPVIKRYDARLHDLVIRNCLAGGFTHKSFSYKTVVYNFDDELPPIKKNRLVLALRPAMEEYLADLKQLNDVELPVVLGFINQVLNSSDGLPDYLDIFPESIHHPLEGLIDTCPCKIRRLSRERVEELRTKNTKSIALIKQRMVTNLLY